jgi:drug/metabolite transporter (DMT)-like permease
MLSVVFLWGTTFVLVKAALAVMPPQWFNSLRMIVAFPCVAIVYRAQWNRLGRKSWIAGGAAGLCLAIGYIFQTQGLVYTTPTNSAFITALVVVLVPCLTSVPLLRPPGASAPGWIPWSGALAAFLGVALLTVPSGTPWQRLFANMNRGDLFTLACAFFFALHVLVLAHATRRVPFQHIALLQIGFAMIVLTLCALWIEPFPGVPLVANITRMQTPLVLFSLFVTGVLATAAAFSIQTWAQQVIPPTNIAVLLTLEPVFAWITSFVFLHARMAPRPALGAILVLAAILVTEIVPRVQRREA